jgi:uncharacterized membrane protein
MKLNMQMSDKEQILEHKVSLRLRELDEQKFKEFLYVYSVSKRK